MADDFDGTALRDDLWIDHYLPQWTTPDRSVARWDLDGAGLRLRIDEDQPDWRPEDAPLRVSNLQTGVFSGGVDTSRGTHRHRPDLVVRTETPERLLWCPASGRVDVTVSASTDEGCMVAAWLVGVENRSPRDSGEVCLFEIDADAVGPTTRARCGIKAHGDDRLLDDMAEVDVALDASVPHTWSVSWGGSVTTISCEGEVVRRIEASPDYPVQLMIDLFEIGPRSTAPGAYPKSARFHAVRGWAARGGA